MKISISKPHSFTYIAELCLIHLYLTINQKGHYSIEQRNKILTTYIGQISKCRNLRAFGSDFEIIRKYSKLKRYDLEQYLLNLHKPIISPKHKPCGSEPFYSLLEELYVNHNLESRYVGSPGSNAVGVIVAHQQELDAVFVGGYQKEPIELYITPSKVNELIARINEQKAFNANLKSSKGTLAVVSLNQIQ